MGGGGVGVGVGGGRADLLKARHIWLANEVDEAIRLWRWREKGGLFMGIPSITFSLFTSSVT